MLLLELYCILFASRLARHGYPPLIGSWPARANPHAPHLPRPHHAVRWSQGRITRAASSGATETGQQYGVRWALGNRRCAREYGHNFSQTRLYSLGYPLRSRGRYGVRARRRDAHAARGTRQKPKLNERIPAAMCYD